MIPFMGETVCWVLALFLFFYFLYFSIVNLRMLLYVYILFCLSISKKVRTMLNVCWISPGHSGSFSLIQHDGFYVFLDCKARKLLGYLKSSSCPAV